MPQVKIPPVKIPQVKIPDRLRRTVRDLARSRGIEVVAIDWDASVAALHTVRILHRYAITTVLDVGARNGEYAHWLRDQGYRGRIVSFEPVPANLDRLQESAAHDPAWTVHPYALGSTTTTLPLQVTASTDFSSFHSPRTDVVATDLDKRTVVEQLDVPVRRLDEVWSQIAPTGPVLLKCDTQGWDLEVLAGAGDRLAQVTALQTEVSNRPIYAGMPDLAESIAAVRGYGFTVSALFPLGSGRDFTPVEFDLIAVRQP